MIMNTDEIEINNSDDTDIGVELFDADPECEHNIISKWSGVQCLKCNGWFCF